MADQRIFFEQGGALTGDSGERGNDTSSDGGVESIKPMDDGERAEEGILNRATENVRRRTEQLRDAGEEAKYLQDSDVRWFISAGNADGLSPGPQPWPGVVWDSVTGTFVTTDPMVVQPINTPAADVLETVSYSFTDGVPNTANVDFVPLTGSPTITDKRAYNGANLIRIIWNAVPVAELAGALVPGFCDIEVSGDPDHIITISIRDDDMTQMLNLASALAMITVPLEGMGLDYTTGGNNATYLQYADITGSPYTDDYRMKENFERELHYIAPAVFATFFATESLSDGDTLAIEFVDYTNEAVPPAAPSGRRQCTPSNSNTTVLAPQLFISSDDVEKIPLAVPLCKRIGDDLIWMDGTVQMATQAGGAVYMGEHGYTINRIINGITNILVNAYGTSPTPPAAVPMVLTNTSLQSNLENITDFINAKGSLNQNENVTGNWQHSGYMSVGDVVPTPAIALYVRDSARAVTYPFERMFHADVDLVSSDASGNTLRAIESFTHVNMPTPGSDVIGSVIGARTEVSNTAGTVDATYAFYGSVQHGAAMGAATTVSGITIATDCSAATTTLTGARTATTLNAGNVSLCYGTMDVMTVANGYVDNVAVGVAGAMRLTSIDGGVTIPLVEGSSSTVTVISGVLGSVKGAATTVAISGGLVGGVTGHEITVFHSSTGVIGSPAFVIGVDVDIDFGPLGDVTSSVYGQRIDIDHDTGDISDELAGQSISLIQSGGAAATVFGSRIFVDIESGTPLHTSAGGQRIEVHIDEDIGSCFGLNVFLQADSPGLNITTFAGAYLNVNGTGVVGLTAGLMVFTVATDYAIYVNTLTPSHVKGPLNLGVAPHPGGLGAVVLAVDGDIAIHSTGKLVIAGAVPSPLIVTGKSVVIKTSAGIAATTTINGGADGQLLFIHNAGAGNWSLNMGGNILTSPGIILETTKGIILMYDTALGGWIPFHDVVVP